MYVVHFTCAAELLNRYLVVWCIRTIRVLAHVWCYPHIYLFNESSQKLRYVPVLCMHKLHSLSTIYFYREVRLYRTAHVLRAYCVSWYATPAQL